MSQKSPSLFDLVDVQTIDQTIHVELKYATKDNFTRQVIYDFSRCFLLKQVALALKRVQEKLKRVSLGLKIWDGFRPISAQWKLWEACPDPKFVSDPKKGGLHTRGTAVDVTLFTKDGQELLMPSCFDDFSERGHIHYKDCSQEACQNRDLLQKVMIEGGFIGYAFEWWHFDFHQEKKSLPILEDIDLNSVD